MGSVDGGLIHGNDLVCLERPKLHWVRVFRRGVEHRMERCVWSTGIWDATWWTGLKAMDPPEWKTFLPAVDGRERVNMMAMVMAMTMAIVCQWEKMSTERWCHR